MQADSSLRSARNDADRLGSDETDLHRRAPKSQESAGGGGGALCRAPLI